MHIKAAATITNNGTGATNIQMTLPVTVVATAGQSVGAGQEIALTGLTLTTLIGGAGVIVKDYKNAYPGGTNAVVDVFASYEF